jgi:Tannase-like family of unknown function (DUF6351)
VCNELFPPHENVRIAAGGPPAGDILKCNRKGIDHREYQVTFTPAERARLRNIFPTGVANGQSPESISSRSSTWLDFTSAH